MRYVEEHPRNRIKAKILIWWGGSDSTIDPGVSRDVNN